MHTRVRASAQRARPHSLNWSRARLGNAEGFADGFNEGFAESFADGVADGFADGDGDVRMQPVAPRRAATAAAAAGRAAPRSRAAELVFTNVKASWLRCCALSPTQPHSAPKVPKGAVGFSLFLLWVYYSTQARAGLMRGLPRYVIHYARLRRFMI